MHYSKKADHARKVLVHCYRLSSLELKFAISMMDRFEMGQKRKTIQESSADFFQVADSLKKEVKAIKRTTGEEFTGKLILEELSDEVEQCIKSGLAMNDKMIRQETDFKVPSMQFYSAFDRVSHLTKKLISSYEDVLKTAPASEIQQKRHLKQLLLYSFFANMILAILSILLIIKSITRRISNLEDKVTELASGSSFQLSESSIHDEIKDLEISFYQIGEELRKRIENQDNLVREAINPIFSIDSGGIIINSNSATTQMLKINPEDSGGEIRVFDFLDDSNQAILKNILEDRSPQPTRIELVLNPRSKEAGENIHTIWSTYWSSSEKYSVLHSP